MDDINEAKTLETQLNVLEAFDTALPAHFRETKNIVLGNIAPHLQTEVLDQIIDPQLVAADTMNFWIDGAETTLRKSSSASTSSASMMAKDAIRQEQPRGCSR